MYQVGQQVKINSPKFPGVFKITKINKVNIKVESLDGMRRVNVHPSFLMPADAPDAPVVTTFEYIHFVLGAIVKVQGRPEKFVVIGTSGATKTRVAKLGGDGDRYLSCPNTMLSAWDDSKVGA